MVEVVDVEEGANGMLGGRVQVLAADASESIALREKVQHVPVGRPIGIALHAPAIGNGNPGLLAFQDRTFETHDINAPRLWPGNGMKGKPFAIRGEASSRNTVLGMFEDLGLLPVREELTRPLFVAITRRRHNALNPQIHIKISIVLLRVFNHAFDHPEFETLPPACADKF